MEDAVIAGSVAASDYYCAVMGEHEAIAEDVMSYAEAELQTEFLKF